MEKRKIRIWLKTLCVVMVSSAMILASCKNSDAEVKKDTAVVEVPEVEVAEAVVEERAPVVVKEEAGLDEVYNLDLPQQESEPIALEEEITETVEAVEVADEVVEVVEESFPPEEAPSSYIGNYMITWYCGCPAHCGNNIGALGVPGGLQPYVHCAVPSYDLLGQHIYVEGVGTFYAADISPGGIVDIFVSCDNPPGWGCIGSAACYLA